mgnify:CR=1 FL=1
MGEILTSYDGFKFYVEKEYHKDPLRYDERTVLTVLVMLGKRDRIFVDVGAGVGRYTVRMSKWYELVYAIEPLPEHVRILKKNLELNNVDNVIVIPYAAYDKSTTLPIYLGGLSSSTVRRHDMKDYIIVKAERLDKLVHKADVIKIDVEGAEFEVVKGAEKLLKSDKPFLVIEHHDFRPDWKEKLKGTFQKVFNYLSSLGYVPLFTTYVHRCWIHKDRLNDLSDEALHYLLWRHWANVCYFNLKLGRDWYYGLPLTWWWGYDFIEFLEELPIHILEEKEWSDPQHILRISKEVMVI